MTAAYTVAEPQRQREDALAHLPCSMVSEYRKGDTIYSQDQPSTSIYLVMSGKVKVSRVSDEGVQVLVDIYQADEFFGESAFLGLPRRAEQASALDTTKVMTWGAAQIEEIVMKRPMLAVAFMQILTERNIGLTHRIENFAVDTISRRLARSLIRFSSRMGTQQEDGSYKMMPFTHELLAQDVGTSREIVTHYMNQFRRQGYLQYSRKGIALYRDALQESLRQTQSAGHGV